MTRTQEQNPRRLDRSEALYERNASTPGRGVNGESGKIPADSHGRAERGAGLGLPVAAQGNAKSERAPASRDEVLVLPDGGGYADQLQRSVGAARGSRAGFRDGGGCGGGLSWELIWAASTFYVEADDSYDWPRGGGPAECWSLWRWHSRVRSDADREDCRSYIDGRRGRSVGGAPSSTACALRSTRRTAPASDRTSRSISTTTRVPSRVPSRWLVRSPPVRQCSSSDHCCRPRRWRPGPSLRRPVSPRSCRPPKAIDRVTDAATTFQSTFRNGDLAVSSCRLSALCAEGASVRR